MNIKFIPGCCYTSKYGAIIRIVARLTHDRVSIQTWGPGVNTWGDPYPVAAETLRPPDWGPCADPFKEPAPPVDAEYRIVDSVVCKCGICHAKFADGVWGTVSRSQS